MAENQIDCPHCDQPVPDAIFCIRCGRPLRERGIGTSHRRGSYAAAPGESVARVALFSTLLPQLPAADLDAFRVAFAGGLVALIALLAVGAFPVALVGAAVLVPALVLIYVYSVAVYEDAPVPVMALTMIWGAVWGILFALAIDAISGPVSGFGDRLLPEVFSFGVVVPLAGMIAMIAGPLILMRDRRYTSVIDGVTFGVASAVAFVAAQVITGSIGLFAGGLTPVGETLPWVGRILVIAIALPVVAAGAVGATVGAFWLRYRATVRDRGALGAAGRPVIAAVLAGALLVAAALATYLPGLILGVAIQTMFAAVALVWLRWTLHLGLLEEALDIEIGDDIVCANCGAATRRHTFCGNCGIALRALPKRSGGSTT